MVRIAAVAVMLPPWGVALGASQASLEGASVRSDFNGDGFSDLAIGVTSEDVGAVIDAGAIQVLFGSPTGLQATSPNDQFVTQDTPGVEDAAEAGDAFGWSLASGDFNNDGYADLAVGLPFEDLGALSDAGAAHVFYGSATGLQATNDQFWTRDSPDVEDAANPDDLFGLAVATHDFNGDGVADLAIGVSGDDFGAQEAGSVQVLYGTSSGLQAISPNDQIWGQASPGVEDSSEMGDFFGGRLVGGDFNADRFGDLAVGVNPEDLGAITDAGAVHILYGSLGGLQAIDPDDQLWTQDGLSVKDVAEVGDSFGYWIVAGDFNDDSFADLAVSAIAEDRETSVFVADAGVVHVLYGSPTGLQSISPDDQLWSQDSASVKETAESGDRFGTSLSAGRFNVDGSADLAIGTPGEAVEGFGGAGAVNVLYGSVGGLQAISPDDQLWTQNSPSVKDSSEAGDGFGVLSKAASDFNGDGFADLAAGVTFEDSPSSLDVGVVAVLYGTMMGLQATMPNDQIWAQDFPGIQDTSEAGDRFGTPLD